MKLNKLTLPMLIVSIVVTGTLEIQKNTQDKMEVILLDKEGSCTKQTKLIVPKGSDWKEKLQQFQTCTEDLTIRVLEGEILEIQDGSGNVSKGKLNEKGSIVPLETE